MNTIIENLRTGLIKQADEKTRISGERFFKEEVRLYGIKTALVSSTAKEHFSKLADKSKSNVFALCEELFKSGIMEESFVACNWSYSVNKQYEPSDFATFEKWVSSYVSNWATCDTLCNHTVGTLVEMYPELIAGLKKWALSGNRWVKRASAVSLIRQEKVYSSMISLKLQIYSFAIRMIWFRKAMDGCSKWPASHIRMRSSNM